MYRQILCPVDGSRTSNLGITEAIKLAKDQDSKLRFIHVIDTYFPIVSPSGDLSLVYIDDLLQKNGEIVLKNAKEQAIKMGLCADSVMVKIDGSVSKSIIDEAKKWPADLIVMGTHGLRGIERLVMGSDAETVARTSPIPILLISSASKPKKSK